MKYCEQYMIMVKCCLIDNCIRMSEVEKSLQCSSGRSVVLYSLNNTLLCLLVLRTSFSRKGTELDTTLPSSGINFPLSPSAFILKMLTPQSVSFLSYLLFSRQREEITCHTPNRATLVQCLGYPYIGYYSIL